MLPSQPNYQRETCHTRTHPFRCKSGQANAGNAIALNISGILSRFVNGTYFFSPAVVLLGGYQARSEKDPEFSPVTQSGSIKH